MVWEKHVEKVDIQLLSNVPVFTEVTEKEIRTDNSELYDFLLEGDNLHSLKLLEKTHHGKVDVIYIDPPYNLGNNDFRYDDSFVDTEDGFRHSKWLSFMSERLLLGWKLLSNTGVMFISIDDAEVAALRMLCDDILGAQAFLASMAKKIFKRKQRSYW